MDVLCERDRWVASGMKVHVMANSNRNKPGSPQDQHQIMQNYTAHI